MRSVRQALIVALAGGAALVGTALPTLADPNLPNIAPHRHFIQTPQGTLVQVGPRVCDDPSLQDAFNQFHVNTHVAAPGSQGPVAPGLHNHRGADIVARGCAFVAP
jgi:hypothetical protein